MFLNPWIVLAIYLAFVGTGSLVGSVTGVLIVRYINERRSKKNKKN